MTSPRTPEQIESTIDALVRAANAPTTDERAKASADAAASWAVNSGFMPTTDV